MYTAAGDSSDEDHYQDFIQTLSFLQSDGTATARTKRALDNYRSALFSAGDDLRPVITTRNAVQAELTRVMCRTERLGQSADRNGMLVEVKSGLCDLTEADIRSYEGLQELCEVLEHIDPTEYWKSAPYVLGLMDDYDLKRRFRHALSSDDCDQIIDTVREHPMLALPRAILTGKGDVLHPHPRLRWLLRETVETNAWRLLWIPPSLPYYAGEGMFGDPRLKNVTKRLVFSAWRVVPKAIALLVSHEVERGLFAGDAMGASIHDVRTRTTAPLEFRREADKLGGLPVFSIVYPSRYLAERADPLRARSKGRLLTAREMRATLATRIDRHVRAIVSEFSRPSAEVDSAWYWAAPLLLDRAHYPPATESFFNRPELARQWATLKDSEETPEGWLDHLREIQNFLQRPRKLGSAPQDLVDVLVDQALGGPATVAFRSLRRLGNDATYDSAEVQLAAARIGWAFRAFFNLPECVAAIRQERGQEIFWQRILRYSTSGNLQAVMDEYMHVLREAEGLYSRQLTDIAHRLADAVIKSLSLRTARVVVDDVRNARSGKEIKQHRLRARFAARFGHQEETEAGEQTPADHTRAAFNSPFWPFVLATTSVGQEGLDFHQYCHAVVHWNVPSNPVDMEQREGRVHRYKGHAVRRNVAAAHSAAISGEDDPWSAMFASAASQRSSSASDIVPYWVYQTPGGAAIERHVPALPLSRDLERLETVKQSLAAYRVVFGQPRQEELVEYLLKRLPEKVVNNVLNSAVINLEPPGPNAR
jgi:hypothetical protein